MSASSRAGGVDQGGGDAHARRRRAVHRWRCRSGERGSQRGAREGGVTPGRVRSTVGAAPPPRSSIRRRINEENGFERASTSLERENNEFLFSRSSPLKPFQAARGSSPAYGVPPAGS